MKHAINPIAFLTHALGEPVTAASRWLQEATADSILLVDFEFVPWWENGLDSSSLTAIYYLDSASSLSCAVTDQTLRGGEQDGHTQFSAWVEAFDLAVFTPGEPLLLDPEYIPKPWGREVWYTGVEARGVCRFTDGRHSAPIPWVQAVMPGAAAGTPAEPLVLLKILDPSPEEVTGDLYFELHEEKREVYVVTHVDEGAWPDGLGGIRYGFDEKLLAQAGSDAEFRRSYLQAVREYEAVRREIDALPEGVRAEAALREREAKLRDAMNAYTDIRPLRVGDVVVVPLLMPHSLLHGVRTIEFQTPVYERQILSFAQKVLTQGHWDTEQAVEQMRLRPPADVVFEQFPASEGVTVERVVDFPDFEVRRLYIPGGRAEIFDSPARYGLAMVVEGDLALGNRCLGPEQAAFLPAGTPVSLAPADPAGSLVLLLAMPRG